MEVVLHDIAKIVYSKIHSYGLQFQYDPATKDML